MCLAAGTQTRLAPSCAAGLAEVVGLRSLAVDQMSRASAGETQMSAEDSEGKSFKQKLDLRFSKLARCPLSRVPASSNATRSRPRWVRRVPPRATAGGARRPAIPVGPNSSSEASWSLLGAVWGLLGASFGPLGDLLEACWRSRGPLGTFWGALGASWEVL